MDNNDSKVSKKIIIISIIVSIFIVSSISFGLYFYFKYKKYQSDTSSIAEREVKSLILDLSNIYIFPDAENPTIAKISDPTFLKNEPFFNSSQKDDIVFIFKKSNKVVLFRPSINKIINISILKNETDSTPITPITPIQTSTTNNSLENISF